MPVTLQLEIEIPVTNPVLLSFDIITHIHLILLFSLISFSFIAIVIIIVIRTLDVWSWIEIFVLLEYSMITQSKYTVSIINDQLQLIKQMNNCM